MTYNYAQSTAVIGPLPLTRHPQAQELCEVHAASFTAPQGWQVIRLASNFEPAPPSESDLETLAQAIRDAAARYSPTVTRADSARTRAEHAAAQSRRRERLSVVTPLNESDQ